MFKSSDSEVWCNLLFKFVSIPFILLLIVATGHQAMSLYNNTALEQTDTGRDLSDHMFF
jgi:hypothetical protein